MLIKFIQVSLLNTMKGAEGGEELDQAVEDRRARTDLWVIE